MRLDVTIYEEVVRLLIVMQAGEADVVTGNTRLHHDLQMDGDDAVEFVEVISDRWSIDWSGFEYSKYFRDEGEVCSLYNLVRDKVFGDKRPLVPITVDHLVSIIEAGKWRDPNEPAV